MTMNSIPRLRSARDTVLDSSGMIQTSFFHLTMNYLKEILSTEQAEIKSLQQELAMMEQSCLCIHNHHGRFFFGCRAEGSAQESGISKDSDRIHSLARRAYLKSRIQVITTNCNHIADLIDLSESVCHELKLKKRLTRYSNAGLDLSRILFTKEQNEWIDALYTPNPHHPEDLKWPTNGGIMMRSKSETAIGNSLEAIGWPYRFDDFVTFSGNHSQARPFRESYFCDFKVPNLLGGITIHEHLGAFQLKQYPDNALKRMNDYHNFEVVELPGRSVSDNEVTFSFESDLRSSSLKQKLIHRMILPLCY